MAYEGSLAVCRLIENNKYLLELDISNNRINWEGAALIAQGLKHNEVLEVLRVCTSIPAADDLTGHVLIPDTGSFAIKKNSIAISNQ